MSNPTPITVNPQGTMWQARVGQGKVLTDGPKKSEVLSNAKRFAIAQERPGVVVFKATGPSEDSRMVTETEFQSFWANEEYWSTASWSDEMEAPMVVFPRDDSGMRKSGKWMVVKGRGRRSSLADTKQEAIEFAELAAESNDRPGVVVHKADKDYDRFIPNEDYWQGWASR